MTEELPVSGPTLSYAAAFADQYDLWFGAPNNTPRTVRLLAELAGSGPVLELGIGTGRLALPLRERGIEVHGIEAAPEMVRRLREKPGGAEIPVTLGDFADVDVDGQFALVYVAAGTFFELGSQEEQLRCFRGVARRLRPGGRFVLDAFLPEALASLATDPPRTVNRDGAGTVRCERVVCPTQQRYRSHYTMCSGTRVQRLTVEFRYAGMGELDLMARTAGLRLRNRWGDWSGGPLVESSRYHVSCYEADAP